MSPQIIWDKYKKKIGKVAPQTFSWSCVLEIDPLAEGAVFEASSLSFEG